MTNNNTADPAAQQPQNPVHSQPVSKVDGASGGLSKGAVADFVMSLANHPVEVVATVAGPAGARIVNNWIIQRGETRREQLRQEGETERARIAQQAADARREPPSA